MQTGVFRTINSVSDKKYNTFEQTHRLVQVLRKPFKGKKYC